MNIIKKIIKDEELVKNASREEIQKQNKNQVSKERIIKYKDFIDDLISKLQTGKINPLKPKTIVDKEIYDTLDEMDQGKVDIALRNIAMILMQLEDLKIAGEIKTKATMDLVEMLKMNVDRVETNLGKNIFII